MSNQSIPAAGIQAAFDRAARAHDTARQSRVAQNQSGRINGPQPATVQQAIANAAEQTSVGFDFLIAQAQVESSMNPAARASTSSASGLYQFIDSTWLGTMQRHGERFGLGDIASQISTTQSGSAYVADPEARASILALRSDPQIASFMAAGLAEDNRAQLAPILGRQPDHSELYLAHFLGADGAGRFLSAMADNPDQSAAALFRRPAAANRPVFYENNGSPRSLGGVMDYLSGKLERARASATETMPQSYAAANLALPIGSDPAETPSPFALTNRAVSSPPTLPTLGGRTTPMIASSAPMSLAPTSPRGSMSSILRSTFGDSALGSSDRAANQIRRAYSQLKALGL